MNEDSAYMFPRWAGAARLGASLKPTQEHLVWHGDHQLMTSHFSFALESAGCPVHISGGRKCQMLQMKN